MKRHISLLMSLILVFLLCACTENTQPTATSSPVLNYTEPPQITFTPAENNTLNGIEIEFIGAELTQDADFNNALRVYVQATNISDETKSVHSVLGFQAMQGDVSLNNAVPISFLRYDGVANLFIRPDTSVRCTEVITLSNLDEQVTVSYHDLLDIDSTVSIAHTFDLKNLPERPEAFFVDLVEEPKWTEGLLTAGAIGSFDVAILDCELITLMEGNEGIRVYVEFKNNSENTVTFSDELTMTLFQDNVSLKSDYSMDDVEEDMNMSLEVAPSSSIVLSGVYELTSESPVEVEISSYWAEGKIGGIYRIKE